LQFGTKFQSLTRLPGSDGFSAPCPSGVRLAKRPPDVSSGKPDKPDLTVEILAQYSYRAAVFSLPGQRIHSIKLFPFKDERL
jgi:hypothetical protein